MKRILVGLAVPPAVVAAACGGSFYEGEAEDKAQVVRTGQTVTVAEGNVQGCHRDSRVEPPRPGVVEEKSLAHGVAVIFEEVVEGGTGRIELISFAPAP